MEAKGEQEIGFEALARKIGRHQGMDHRRRARAERGSGSGVAADTDARSDGPRGPDRPHHLQASGSHGVYGPTIKALIHEEFGEGIMSALNFRLDLGREEDPGGDWVKITYSGKFLPYQW